MAKVLYLALKFGDYLPVEAQVGFPQIACNREYAFTLPTESFHQGLKFPLGIRSGQHIDIAVSLRQLLDKVATDEAGAASDKVVCLALHFSVPLDMVVIFSRPALAPHRDGQRVGLFSGFPIAREIAR